MQMISIGNGGGDDGIESKYDFLTLPFIETEADENNVICEFTGGANTNETAVGGGLSGADLVLSQFGNVPAAANGGRLLPIALSGFHVTTAFKNFLATSPKGGSLMWRWSEYNFSSARYSTASVSMADNSSYSCPASYAYDMFSITDGKMNFTKHTPYSRISAGRGTEDSDKVYPSNGEIMVVTSVDLEKRVFFSGLAHFVDHVPVGLTEYETFSLGDFDDGTVFPALNAMRASWNCNGNSGRAVIVGGPASSPGYSIDARILSFTMTDYPCVVKK